MSDEHVEDVEDPQSSGDVQELSRKEKAAARRAEFEAAKEAKAAAKAEQQAAKNAEKAAATAAAREEKLAAKKAQDEIRAAAKAAKEAKRAAKKEAKAATRTEKDVESGEAASKSGSKEKTEKDPYRPRFAVAPGKIRVFTVLAAVLAVLYGTLAALLVFAAASSSVLAYAAAAGALLVAVLWVVSASLLCAGRVQGKYLGVVVLVLGLPLSLVAAPLLFSDDVRSWAL